jgi:hypothetical protein
MDSAITDLILEYTQEGYLYLYEEQPENMEKLHSYLSSQQLQGEVVLFRRTDWEPFLKAKEGDKIINNRVTSWSRDDMIVNDMYDGVDSVYLILENFDKTRGVDVSTISIYKDEHEILLTPSIFTIVTREEDIIWVRVENNI